MAIDQPLAKLKKKLDEVFSKFIRMSYANDEGIVKCFTCGKFEIWKYVDCGHYIPRDCMPLRYDEKNCHPQCKHCNITLKGNYTKYARNLVLFYGKDILDLLELKRRNLMKWTRWEYTILIKHYTEEVKKLEKRIG